MPVGDGGRGAAFATVMQYLPAARVLRCFLVV